MDNRDIDYTIIEEIPDEGVRLFKIMMRLEFALKYLGYCKTNKFSAVEVNWDRYCSEKLGAGFFAKMSGDVNVIALIQTRPQKQIIDQNRELSWEQQSNISSTQDLIGALRRVRNNLFHGGKSDEPDSDRNVELYKAALYVIDQILRNDDTLKTVFTGRF